MILTSAPFATAKGWPLELTTHTATLYWSGGRRAMSMTIVSSLRPLGGGGQPGTPGRASPLCTSALLLVLLWFQKQHSRTKPNLSNTRATRSRSGVSLLLPFHVRLTLSDA